MVKKTFKKTPSRHSKTRGGKRYSVGTLKKDRYGNLSESKLDRTFTEGSLENLGDSFKRPRFNVCALKNVSSLPNTDPNYKHVAFLFANYVNPYDYISLEWFIEKYLQDVIIPKLQETNKYSLSLENGIKIHNFSISMIKEDDYMLKGEIYINKLDELNEKIDKKLDKLPTELVQGIKEYF